MASASVTADATPEPNACDASRVELPCFHADACHVHVNIPPTDTLGHRAESWNVTKPNYTCQLKGLTRGDTFILRLLTDEGELFAESLWEPDRPMVAVRPHNTRKQSGVTCVTLRHAAQPSCAAACPAFAWRQAPRAPALLAWLRACMICWQANGCRTRLIAASMTADACMP
jgi:hypothetical protein